MRNLKRALSLGLASVMVIGMMAVGASAVSYDDLTDKDEIVNKEAVQMLVELGVINGKDDGSYDPTGIVTRAEMAKMICVVLNGGKDPNLGTAVTNSYTDTVGHWAAGYIEYCTQLGIVAGDGTGKFNPSATVTGSEAAKMLLVAMGYKSEIEGFTGANWALAVNTRASQKGLYDGLSINADAGLSRDNAAQMIYNALDASIVEYEYTLVTDGSSLSSSPTLKDKVNNEGYNVTLLEDRFNAVKVEGVVVANEYATLNSTSDKGSAMDEGKTRIVVTNHDDQGYYTDGATTFSTTTDLEDLGRSVVLYVKKNPNSSKAEIFGTAIESGDNLVVKDTSTDSINDVTDDNDLTYDADAQIAYNYGKLADLTSDDRSKEWDRGTEKFLIDNDDDGDVDYVLVNTMYFGQVSKYSTRDDGSITVDINRAWELNGTATNLTADDKADVVGFDDVAEDDYVMAGWIGGKLYVSVADSITGTLEAMKTGESLTVDGTKYNAAEIPGYRGGDSSIVGGSQVTGDYLDNEATFYLDANGLVVAAGDAAEAAGNYAYVWAVGTDVSGIDSDRVKVTLQDGTTATYNMTSNSARPSVTTDTAKDGEDVNRVYSYSINSDGEIKLTAPKKGTTTADNVEFTKGKTSIAGWKEGANSNTVFFYVSMKDKSQVIDDVDVYTGYTNAPSVKDIDVEAAYNNAGKMAAVAFEGGTVSIKDMSDYLYLSKIVSVSSEYSTVEAVLAGTDEAVEIRVNDTDLGDDDVNVLWLFSVDDEGNYDLEEPTGEGYTTANADRVSSTTLVIGDGEYDVTDETVWIEQKTNGKFDVANVGKLPSSLTGLKVVETLYNSDEELLAFVTIPTETSNEDKPTVGDYTANAKVEGSEVVIRYYKTEPNALQIGDIMAADLKDYEVANYKANEKTVEVNGITLDVKTQEVVKVTYNGAAVGETGYFDKGTADITVTASADDVKVLDGKTTAGDADYTAVDGEFTVTADADMSLVDAYTVTWDTVAKVTLDGKDVTKGNLVATGKKITITSSTTDGNSITVNGEKVGEPVADGTAVTYELTVSKNVTISEQA